MSKKKRLIKEIMEEAGSEILWDHGIDLHLFMK